MMLQTDSSPFQSSPIDTTTSPRMFWQNRNSENMLYGRNGSPSPTRRSSIERLQKASRVKNSNILALEQKQEYDPTRLPHIERPLAKVQGNAFRLSNTSGLKSSQSESIITEFNRSETYVTAPMMSPKPTLSPSGAAETPRTPSKDQASPIKSSMSPTKFKGSYDHETGQWEEDSEHELPSGRVLHRHAKSVTFNAAPPQINEYEVATPDLSSVGTNSREGSYESMGDEEDDSVLYDPSRMDGHEESFDASLEDTDKTPVVGPDDWRGDSPLVHHGRQPEQWDGSPMPEAPPSMAELGRVNAKRSESANAAADHRPLPPLPGFGHARSKSIDSTPASPALSATAERMLGSHRSLPCPPAASASKSDIQNIGNGKMTLEERLRLMMLSDDNNSSGKTAAEQQRERRLRRANGRERFSSPMSEPESTVSALEAAEEDDTVGDISLLSDYQLPTRISRESIMRRVNGNKTAERESDWNFSSPAPSSSPQRSPLRSPERLLPSDPDVPIPSTEQDSILEDSYDEEDGGSVIITRDTEDEYDMDDDFDISLASDAEVFGDDVRPQQCLQDPEERSQSEYSDQNELPHIEPEMKAKEEEAMTPRASSPVNSPSPSPSPSLVAAPAPPTVLKPTEMIPDLGPHTRYSGFSRDFESYMLQEPDEDKENEPQVEEERPKSAYLQRPSTPEQPSKPVSKPEYDGSGWGEPEEDYDDEPGTPESVIRHPVAEDEANEVAKTIEEQIQHQIDQQIGENDAQQIADEEAKEERKESPAIPERMATIKASGSKLKTRVSNTPSDLAAMREARRQVSYEVPGVPPIPDKHHNRLSKDMTAQPDPSSDDFLERHPSFKNRSLTLDLDLGLSLDQDFDRVIESQKVAYNFPKLQQLPTSIIPSSRQASRQLSNNETKKLNANVSSRNQRGYLMRQNTKLVTASDTDRDESWKARSAGNSPIKQANRPQSWTVEPWNSKTRQGTVRKRSGTGPAGPVPPMPGKKSNATALGQVAEEDDQTEMATGESGERGRLFVKVMGVKDLELPIPRSKSHLALPQSHFLILADERTWFSLTLDNGVHCVTTAWLELARNAPIGQEFELVVPNDLEFQLTLNVKLDKPAPIKLNAPVATQQMSRPKPSTFSRVFASPKKRKELETRHREEEARLAQQQQQQRDALARQRNAVPTAYELLSPLTADDGSFARSYVCLKEHENRCFGRPYVADVACFNEWATEEAGFANSVKSKRGNTAVVRRAPYKIGKLELQLLFVPRPKNSTDDDMPKSMNSCIREMKAAEERLSRSWEGPLSQQGGDCPVSLDLSKHSMTFY